MSGSQAIIGERVLHACYEHVILLPARARSIIIGSHKAVRLISTPFLQLNRLDNFYLHLRNESFVMASPQSCSLQHKCRSIKRRD